jgi:hypothetical protein
MKLGTLFTLNGVVAAIFGVGFIVAPAQLLEMYAVTINPGTALVSRLFGAALVGFAVISWQSRAAAPSDARQAVIVGYFIADTIGTILGLHGVLTAATNSLGWLTVVIYALFAAGFGMFAFAKGTPARP